MQKFSGGARPQTPLEIVCLRTRKMALPPLDFIHVHCAPLGNFLNEGVMRTILMGDQYYTEHAVSSSCILDTLSHDCDIKHIILIYT